MKVFVPLGQTFPYFRHARPNISVKTRPEGSTSPHKTAKHFRRNGQTFSESAQTIEAVEQSIMRLLYR